MTDADLGYLASLTYHVGGGGSPITIANILSVTPSKVTTEKVIVQTFDSGTLYGDKIPGWMDAADFELKVVYNKSQAGELYTLHDAQTVVNWVFTKPDGTTTASFAGFLSEVGDETPLKSFMTNDIKITVSGDYTFTPGS